MKTKHSRNGTRDSAFTAAAAALLAVISLFTTVPRALAQTGWGNALSFDGVDDHVVVPSGIWFSNDFTVETWVYVRSYNNYSRLIDFGNGAGADNVILALSHGTTGRPDFALFRSNIGTGVIAPDPLPTNQWVHLAATLRSNTATIYVNGTTVVTNTVTPPAAVNRTNNYIGRSNWGADQNANAIFDDLRIWRIARSAADIQANMNRQLTGTEPGLVANYPFDEGAGTKAYDVTTNHLDGALVNAPTWAWRGSALPYVVTLAASGVSLAQATLNGLVNPDAVTTTAWIQWGATTSYGNTTTETNLGSGTNSVPVSASFSGIAANVTYHYRVVASNSLGVAYGTDRTFTIRAGAVTTLSDDGAGSLRQAILNAAPGTIFLLTNTGTITLTSGELAINKDLGIVGPGAGTLAISGNNASRVFNIAIVTVSISGLTIRDGKSADGGAGAAGQPGGGIYNAGVLTLSDCVLTNTRAGNGGIGSAGTGDGGYGGAAADGGSGGAIYNTISGAVCLNRCTLVGNTGGAGGQGGAANRGYNTSDTGHRGGNGGTGGTGGAGGAIFSDGSLTMDRCTLCGNKGGPGGPGGVGGNGGNNDAVLGIHYHWGGDGGPGGVGGVGGSGGGIQGEGDISLSHCTISSNESGTGGSGGNGGNGGSGSTTGHKGAGGDGGPSGNGGGLYNNDKLTLFSCTIAFDATGAGGTGGPLGSGTGGGGSVGVNGTSGNGGGIFNTGSARPPSIVNTIVGLNTRPTNIPDDVFGSFSSSGHNLIGNTTDSTGFVASDLLNQHPVLGSLADNGGPTRTCTPLPGSPAINAGNNAYAPATDQRDLPRVASGSVDIGAIEFQYWPAVTTLPASNISATGTVARATLNGVVNPGGPMTTTAWFEWEDGVALRRTTPIAVGSGTADVAVSANLTGLTAGVSYRYRMVTTNALGFDHGAELRFCAPMMSAGPLTWTCHDDYVEPGLTVSSSPTTIAAGGGHNLVLKPDGTVVAWGRNGYGQTNVPAGLKNVVAIAAGDYHSLALRADGTVVGWGRNDFGQTNAPAGFTGALAIAAGGEHSLAIKADGTVVGWGNNDDGQTNSPAGLNNVVAIAAGGYHSLAIKADGTVLGWGRNDFSQTNCPAGLNNVVAIAAGGEHSLALRADGTVVGWGNNSYGQTNSPAGLNNVVAIAAGDYHSLALKADGKVVCWGLNTSGQTNSPNSLSNVVAIAAGDYHSLALKADGTVVGWGLNLSGQTNSPAGPTNLDLTITTAGTVDVNVPGSYVLTYTTTNAFGGAGMTTRTVQVMPATPLVSTQPATDVGTAVATLRGEVNPRGAGTLAWFEYGLTTKYGTSTATTNLGSYPYHLGISRSLTGLLPWMTYHFRAVASNSVGRINGPDLTFTLPGPFGPGNAPSLSDLTSVTLPQGGSTNIAFAVSPAALDVRVGCNNPVLLPVTGIGVTGVGAYRWLSLVPNPYHSGAAQVTVTASDGTRATSDTFTVTVTPSAGGGSGLLRLANVAANSPQHWRFRIEDTGTGSTNYTVEYRSDLSPTNNWTVATNVMSLGGGVFEVGTGPPQRDTGFYRVKGLCWLTGGLDSTGATMDESAAFGAVIVFNQPYQGTASYTWGGTEGTNTGTVQVNGTTAVIPIPSSFVNDNIGINPLKFLTLRLNAGSGFVLAGTTESSITVQENDAEWQGTLIIPNGLARTTTVLLTNLSSGGHTNITLPQTADMVVGFTLRIQQSGACFQGQIQSDGAGFFPTNALVQLTLTENCFTAAATNVPLPALTSSPLFSGPSHVDVRLDADNARTNQSVGPAQISGVATLVSVVPGRPYLDSLITGKFLLLKPAPAPSTNQVPLYPAP